MSGGSTVTLLFTDLVGSTELLERLGDDAAEELRQAHFGILRDAVALHGGQEVKSLGDGLMVAFTSALAAARCAMESQRAVERHNRRRPDRGFGIRIGLQAGEAIPAEGDYFGRPVVVAKRLCDRAASGQVLVSALVRELIGARGGLRFRRLGPLELKGLDAPVEAFELQLEAQQRGGGAPAPADSRGADAPAVRPARRPAASAMPLVGRGDELAELRAELRRASAGEFRCVLLLGDAGVGKTRLAHELLARSRGAHGLSARAYPLGGTTSFGLWIEALERHLRDLARDELRAICGGFLDDLAAVFRSVAAVRGSAPQVEPPRLRLLEGLAVLVGNLAGEAPLVLVLDDAHLADASSWQALHYLAGSLPERRVLVIATARPAELGREPAARELALRLEQEGQLRRMHLEPLPSAAVRDLTAAALGRPLVPAALVDWLSERSLGNPLFALGLLQALLDEGADLEAPRLRSIPEALSERVSGRVAELAEPELAALELLAIVGRRIELPELESLAGRPRDRLEEILEALVSARLVVEEERGRDLAYEIAHPLVQETIYARMRRGRRRALHRQTGRGLLAGGRLGEAAPHFARSAEPGDDEAIRALCDAVRQADERESHTEEIAILEALLELIPDGDERWLDVLDAMSAHANWVVEHRADLGADTGIRAMRQIEQVLARSGDLGRRATAKLRLACFLGWGRGELEEGEAQAREALELFRRAGDDAGARLAENELVWARGLSGDHEGHLAGARALLERAEAAGDRLATLQAVGNLGSAATVRGAFELAVSAFERSARIAREDGKRYRLTWSLSTRANAVSLLGRLDEALTLFEEAAAGDPAHPETLLLELRARVEWMCGRFAAALDTMRESLAWNRGELSRRRAWALGYAAMAAAELGRLPEARELLERGTTIYGGRPFWFWYCDIRWAAAAVTALEGDSGGALHGLEATAAELLERGAVGHGGFVLADLADVAARAGNAAAAATAADRLGAIESAAPPNAGLAPLARAHAALAAGEAERASREAEAATGALGAAGFAAHRARALALRGRALAPDDRNAAIAALADAGSAFEACGATVRRRAVVDLMGELGAPGRRAADAAAGPTALSQREREVAALAAEGRTAREIGTRLFIGKRTVETHLARAYAKLGVTSKLELVRRRDELGL